MVDKQASATQSSRYRWEKYKVLAESAGIQSFYKETGPAPAEHKGSSIASQTGLPNTGRPVTRDSPQLKNKIKNLEILLKGGNPIVWAEKEGLADLFAPE
jgi:hypothetical protein